MPFRSRLGILTAGGDCPGLNAVIHGATRAADSHAMEMVGMLGGYEGLLDPLANKRLTPIDTNNLISRGGTILGSTNRGHFVATQGMNGRVELDPEIVEVVRCNLELLDIGGLICVGGDGSLAIAQQLHEAGIPVVGVPKTIDNDVSATAFTFGFDSAVACATDALDRLHTTAESHGRVICMEVMGRYAGWIALHAGIAAGCDVILVPELQWSLPRVCEVVRERLAARNFSLVVVAEGVGEPEEGTTDIVGQPRLGGASERVAQQIEAEVDCEVRNVVLGHLQRGGSPTAFDRVLATQFGAHAVRLLLEDRLGEMVCYQPPSILSVPLEDAIQLSRVTPDCSIVQAARSMGISFGEDKSPLLVDELANC